MTIKLYKNKKTGVLYQVLDTIINATNAQDNQIMIKYSEYNSTSFAEYCREKDEFYDKFEYVRDEPGFESLIGEIDTDNGHWLVTIGIKNKKRTLVFKGSLSTMLVELKKDSFKQDIDAAKSFHVVLCERLNDEQYKTLKSSGF